MIRRLVVIAILLGVFAACRPSSDRVVIGTKNFTEQAVLGEILAQYLESRGMRVDRRFYLAGSYVCDQALLAGRIDLYVEYTGTALTAILKQQPSGDHGDVYQRVKQGYAARGIVVTEPLGFNNTFAMVIRRSDAEQFHWRTLSDFAPYAPQRRLGVGYEFMERPDGYQGLARTYGFRFAEAPRVMDLGLIYRALINRQVDMIAAANTDGLIAANSLTVLDDDRHYFPPYDAVPLVRQQSLERFPQLGQALAELGGKLTEQDMRAMNYAVDGEHRDISEVAREFLGRKRLLGGTIDHKLSQSLH